MKKLIKVLIAIIPLVFIPNLIIGAQDSGQDDARYLVQSGDSLSAIALRFNISQIELVNVNNLSNPNQLSSGTELILPGYSWISGLLVSENLTYGENLDSLSRKYRISKNDFARLNNISSPQQLRLGSNILMPTERGEILSAGRLLLGSGTSIFEMAVSSKGNPWSILEANGLVSSWESTPNTILYTPAIDQPGPGALPSPINEVLIGASGFVQGRAVSVGVGIQNHPNDISISLLGNRFEFLRFHEDYRVAIIGNHALSETGIYALTLTIQYPGESAFSYTQMIKLSDGGYTYERVPVDLPNQGIASAEIVQLHTIVSPVTETKLWQGLFQLPTPFGDVNSYFGTRRSYNGSPYDYYHGGVDFGGGLGTQVFAPAAGEVVFAGVLEIRGNATIINHGWGVYTGYFHQDQILVSVGDRVEVGQVIGIVGNTGSSSGAHLHWNLWVGGVQVDPLDWLEIQFP